MDQYWTLIYHLGLIFLFNYTFYSHYNTDWIANTEIDLDQNNSVIMRLWCSEIMMSFPHNLVLDSQSRFGLTHNLNF